MCLFTVMSSLWQSKQQANLNFKNRKKLYSLTYCSYFQFCWDLFSQCVTSGAEMCLLSPARADAVFPLQSYWITSWIWNERSGIVPFISDSGLKRGKWLANFKFTSVSEKCHVCMLTECMANIKSYEQCMYHMNINYRKYIKILMLFKFARRLL